MITLGIDYGSKNLGVAIADGPLARPLTTLDTSDKNVLDHLTKLALDNEAKQIVIGLPEGNLDSEVQAFGQKVADFTSLPVAYHPETLSTQEALAKLRQAGAGKAKLQNDHVYAACLILEDYLATTKEL